MTMTASSLSHSVFFSDLVNKGSACARERLFRLASFIRHMVIFVSGALSSKDYEKKRDVHSVKIRLLTQTLSNQNKL